MVAQPYFENVLKKNSSAVNNFFAPITPKIIIIMGICIIIKLVGKVEKAEFLPKFAVFSTNLKPILLRISVKFTCKFFEGSRIKNVAPDDSFSDCQIPFETPQSAFLN